MSVAGIASSTRPAGGGKTWAVSALPTPLYGVATVGCVRARCVAGDQGDNLLVSTTPARGASAWERFNLGQGSAHEGTLQSISYPTSDFCVAGDYEGNIVSSTNPTNAASWSVKTIGSPPAPGPWYAFESLSCASQNLCAAVAISEVLISTDPTGGAAAWNVATLPSAIADQLDVSFATSISCPSADLCVVGSGDGSVLTTTDPTGGVGAWTSQQLGLQPYDCGKYGCRYDSTDAVSCASPQLCAATDLSDLWVSTDPEVPGTTSIKSQLPGVLSALTCPADNLCVGASRTQVEATTDPSNPSPTWTITHLPKITTTVSPGTQSFANVDGISCASTQLCVAIDGSTGYAFTGNPSDPRSWTATRVDRADILEGVSCAPSGPCSVVDTGENLIIGRVSG